MSMGWASAGLAERGQDGAGADEETSSFDAFAMLALHLMVIVPPVVVGFFTVISALHVWIAEKHQWYPPQGKELQAAVHLPGMASVVASAARAVEKAAPLVGKRVATAAAAAAGWAVAIAAASRAATTAAAAAHRRL